jgi:hypothetical protein
MRTITRNGQTVECYGDIAGGTNNVYALFTDEYHDAPYCMDRGESTWTEVVETLTAYATRYGVELVELQAI